jgi:hypothetical protein
MVAPDSDCRWWSDWIRKPSKSPWIRVPSPANEENRVQNQWPDLERHATRFGIWKDTWQPNLRQEVLFNSNIWWSSIMILEVAVTVLRRPSPPGMLQSLWFIEYLVTQADDLSSSLQAICRDYNLSSCHLPVNICKQDRESISFLRLSNTSTYRNLLLINVIRVVCVVFDCSTGSNKK